MNAWPDPNVPPSSDTPFALIEDESQAPPTLLEKPWKIVIADDDDAVHTISKMVLRDFSFEGRYLNFLSAHSAEATRRLIEDNPDCAILLLDVVMETDNAGLDVVRFVREVLHNNFVRIILRTGQPGQAPEKWVVVNYDINDYKEKTELTAQKLVTTVVSALRAYRDIQIIDASRRGLEQIIDASRNLFERQSLAQFSAGVLHQLNSLLHLGEDSLYVQSAGFAAKRETDRDPDDFIILAGTGRYEETVGRNMSDVVSKPVARRLLHVRQSGHTLIDINDFVGYFRTSNGSENLVYLHTRRPLNELDTNLLRVFATNAAIAFDNLYLNDELTSTQVELINTLGEVVETRSNETGRHVFRVGEYARLMGQKAGLSQRDCDLLRLAAPMHDLGKIGIPDAILCKPGKLTPNEFEVMKTHTTIGYNLLKGSRREGLRAAAIIAQQHHEWWDGGGYPHGLRGENIHIFGRIVAMADIFDALANKRIYKDAWPVDKVVDYVVRMGGSKFDPRLVKTLQDNLDDFLEILARYPDQPLKAAA